MAYHWEIAETVRALALPLLPSAFSVCEFGDQYVQHGADRFLASTFYREAGCGRYVSIDANGRGDLCADLNRPLPAPLLGAFHLVTDIGTGEHIFHQAQVWRSLHDLCRVGGVIVCDRPASGYPTHGYYLTEPGLFDDLAAANHYETIKLWSRTTSRGDMICGIFQRTTRHAFVMPQQRRYQKSLQL